LWSSFPMSRYVVGVAVLLAFASPASASTEDAKGYTCTFKIGAAYAQTKGRFKQTKAGPVTLDIAGVNHAKQEAELVSGERRAVLRIIRAVNAVHFLEAVGEGYLNLTTIYDRDAGAATHSAVHSRHFGVLGQPIVSQYRGTCVAKI
jgi:hypothetical protein